MNRILCRFALLIPFVLGGFALPQLTHARSPQICDSNGNTAPGDGALSSNTTGSLNTATGVNALFENATGINNTANGF